ncbi:hypothetical protein Cni_G02043 [Canna indica]|uniref:Uncharacterized protein n=1 Tax=Canna indica TaxID=4628 RepID=A0AAQ3JPB5_9LILI|nr:hypothetical protein Cni_G02043 [Canna indica]
MECRVWRLPKWSSTEIFSLGVSDGDEEEEGSRWRVFSLKELHSATNNFNYDNKLGERGFCSVYWGQLWDGSQVGRGFSWVAIKTKGIGGTSERLENLFTPSQPGVFLLEEQKISPTSLILSCLIRRSKLLLD